MERSLEWDPGASGWSPDTSHDYHVSFSDCLSLGVFASEEDFGT